MDALYWGIWCDTLCRFYGLSQYCLHLTRLRRLQLSTLLIACSEPELLCPASRG